MIDCFIAEDEQILRRGLTLTIDWNALGCRIIGEAENGAQALDLIQKLKPDLIITDIRMPVLDGLSLIEKTLEQYRPEFIIISGYNDFAYAKKAIRLGAADYLCKPIDEKELTTAVTEVCKKIAGKQAQALQNMPVKIIAGNKLLLPNFKEFVPQSAGRKNKYISNAIRFIQQNYGGNITMRDACKHLVISESYLTKLFKEYTGYSFIEYLTYWRMKKACELLNTDGIKIYAVAERVGYSDQRYFSVLFKKYTGLTPKQFREKQFSIE